MPAPDYDVVVFENRFPSLSGVDGATAMSRRRATASCPHRARGRCEVIAFSSDHTGSSPTSTNAHARLVVEAWRHRTAELMARPGIEQVFCFENRGEEIGVTLTHPHGQIYGFPYLTPRTTTMLAQARAHRDRHGTNLFADILADEVGDGGRIIARDDAFTAFVPFASRWPVEVHIYPNRFVRNLIELDDAELDGFARIYLDVLRRFDRMYTAPLPYMSALHQYTDDDAQREGYFHVELISTRRSATKLKYLASSESAMEAFINDTTPEDCRRSAAGAVTVPRAPHATGHFRAPGRINLIGEHTDYNVGFALPIALPERTVVSYQPDDSDSIVVRSDRETGAGSVAARHRSRRRRPAGLPTWRVWCGRCSDAGHRVPGGTMSITGGVEMGSGLASSAALECAVLGAILAATGQPMDRIEQARIAQRAENEYVGAPTGLLDQLAILHAEPRRAQLIDFRASPSRSVPFDPDAQRRRTAADQLACHTPACRRRVRRPTCIV